LKIISLLVNLGCSLFAGSNITDLLQEKHPEILAGIGGGCGKWLLAYRGSNIPETGQI